MCISWETTGPGLVDTEVWPRRFWLMALKFILGLTGTLGWDGLAEKVSLIWFAWWLWSFVYYGFAWQLWLTRGLVDGFEACSGFDWTHRLRSLKRSVWSGLIHGYEALFAVGLFDSFGWQEVWLMALKLVLDLTENINWDLWLFRIGWHVWFGRQLGLRRFGWQLRSRFDLSLVWLVGSIDRFGQQHRMSRFMELVRLCRFWLAAEVEVWLSYS